MKKRADLHIHTTASDGFLTPTEAVEIAARLGLSAVALTDHDTVDGINEARSVGLRFGVEVIPGVEISVVHLDKVEIHILGYFIDYTNSDLLKRLQCLKEARWERGRKMVELLNGLGIMVSFDRVKEIAAGGIIGRPHVARAMVEVGAVTSMDSAFGRYLQEGGPAFVPRAKVTPDEAICLIKSSGGVACCAHVGKLKRDNLVVEVLKLGVQALEVYHPDHTTADSRYYERFAAKRGLIATGGSDAHGFHNKPNGGIGLITVDCSVVEELRAAAGSSHPSTYS